MPCVLDPWFAKPTLHIKSAQVAFGQFEPPFKGEKGWIGMVSSLNQRYDAMLKSCRRTTWHMIYCGLAEINSTQYVLF